MIYHSNLPYDFPSISGEVNSVALAAWTGSAFETQNEFHGLGAAGRSWQLPSSPDQPWLVVVSCLMPGGWLLAGCWLVVDDWLWLWLVVVDAAIVKAHVHGPGSSKSCALRKGTTRKNEKHI